MSAMLTANTTAVPLTIQAIAKIDDHLDAYAQTGRFSGNVMVTRGPGTALIRSYGLANREHGIVNSLHTKFRIGSITKQFTAVAIFQLQAQGKLDLQAPLSDYLPNYPEGDRISIHQLLTHTAGVPEYLNPEIFPEIADWVRLSTTLDQIIDRFKELPLGFEPGMTFEYSNSGYILLTKVIEVVSQQSYNDYVQVNICEPLGLDNTGYELPWAVVPDLAQGYIAVSNSTYLRAEPIDMSVAQGAGGLYSTLSDLNTWNAWLYSRAGGSYSVGGHSVKGLSIKDGVLSEHSLRVLLSPVVEMSSPQNQQRAYYGYGFVHDIFLGRERIRHNSSINGFRSTLVYYPEEALSIILLANSENAPVEKISKGLAAIAFEENVAEALYRPNTEFS